MPETHTHGHHHDHAASARDHGHGAGHADVLDLDALVVGHLDELLSWIDDRLTTAPARALDLGAGSGTGAIALTRFFPEASVIALDRSTDMLSHLQDAVARAGLDRRVATVHADADTEWPEMGSFDLVWAASSLHHMSNPGLVLRRAHAALAVDGVLAVTEMDGLPRFLPSDLGFGRPGLEQRCHDAMRERGWNAHPDWTSALEEAGFVDVERRTFTYRREAVSAEARGYARRIFATVRAHLGAMIGSADAESIDCLLDDDDAGSLARRDDLVVTSARTIWVGRRG